MQIVTYAADVGSTKQTKKGEISFGWARMAKIGQQLDVSGAIEIDELIHHVRADLSKGFRISLGMECPIFLPVPSDSAGLSCGRKGEGSLSCFAPAGGYVATLGLHQLAYILQTLRSSEQKAVFHVDEWLEEERRPGLLLWEAFVSGEAHCPKDAPFTGVRDAATAAWAFVERLEARRLGSDVSLSDHVAALSLAGAALLWAGWTDDISVLRKQAFVVRPTERYTGPVPPLVEG